MEYKIEGFEEVEIVVNAIGANNFVCRRFDGYWNGETGSFTIHSVLVSAERKTPCGIEQQLLLSLHLV